MLATCQIQANYQQARKMLQADPVVQQVITGRFKRDLKPSSSGLREQNMIPRICPLKRVTWWPNPNINFWGFFEIIFIYAFFLAKTV